MSQPWKINHPLSQYTTKLLQMYLKFPEGQPITAMDWRAFNGSFLHQLTSKHDQRFLY